MLFENWKIFILDDGEIYQFNSDYSKTNIEKKDFEEIKKLDPRSIVVFDKELFLQEKLILLDKNNPNRMSEDSAIKHYKMGFITKKELEEYVN